MQNPFETIEQRLEGIEIHLADLKKSQLKEKPSPLINEKLTRKELCQRYKISLGTVHSLMRSGKLSFSKFGRKTLFASSEVEALFEENKKRLIRE